MLDLIFRLIFMILFFVIRFMLFFMKGRGTMDLISIIFLLVGLSLEFLYMNISWIQQVLAFMLIVVELIKSGFVFNKLWRCPNVWHFCSVLMISIGMMRARGLLRFVLFTRLVYVFLLNLWILV